MDEQENLAVKTETNSVILLVWTQKNHTSILLEQVKATTLFSFCIFPLVRVLPELALTHIPGHFGFHTSVPVLTWPLLMIINHDNYPNISDFLYGKIFHQSWDWILSNSMMISKSCKLLIIILWSSILHLPSLVRTRGCCWNPELHHNPENCRNSEKIEIQECWK